MKAIHCEGCGERTRASGRFCRFCNSQHRRTVRRIEKEGLVVDVAGGSWWVWSAKGEVLVIGKPNRSAAIHALAFGDPDMPEQEAL